VKLFKNVKIILPEEVVTSGGLLVSDKIEKLVDAEEIKRLEKSSGLEVIDGKGLYLAPGLIDLHIHGASGYDTMDASSEALEKISLSLARKGTTSFLPTTMTMPVTRIKEALANIGQTKKLGTRGARILGAHLEGPFINPEKKGAQAESDILLPDFELFEDEEKLIKMVTIAPELPDAERVIRHFKEQGIVVSCGHTAASYDQIIEAREWGISHATHLFNGMVGLHHRRPGVVGAVLTTDLSCELIADLIHIHPAVLNLVLQVKDLDQIILVTDQMEAGSLGDGVYSLGSQQVIVKDGACRLENGQLAGSVLTLNQAAKNIYQISNLSLPEVIRLATINPAHRLGLDQQIGQISAGYLADLILFDDEFEVRETYLAGEKVY